MITKNQIKFVQSLQIKKNRIENNLFLVEGSKNVLELLNSTFKVIDLFITDQFFEQNQAYFTENFIPYNLGSNEIIAKMSSFQSNNAAVAVVQMPNIPSFELVNEWVLILDDIKDPGNLGTIIRVADWYGISKIVCSPNTVDCYNPKVVNATMGSYARVQLWYQDLTILLSKYSQKAILGAFMNGKSIYTIPTNKEGFLVIGNESNGISNNIEDAINLKVTIPRIGHAESLNAGIATAILLDNLLGR